MIFLVNRATKMIINRYEAWEQGSYDQAYADIKAMGGKNIDERITLNGDMVIEVDL